MAKPKLLVIHGKKHFGMPTFAESDAVREKFEIRKACREIVGKPDVIFSQSFSQCSAQLHSWGGPKVIIVGGNPWHEFKLNGLGGRLNSFRKLFERQTAVLCQSRFLRDSIRKHLSTDNVFALPRGLWGVDHVDNGVRPERFTPKTDWKATASPVAITSIIMSNNRVKETKWRGIPLFLSAVEKVARKNKVRFLNSARGDCMFRNLAPWRKRWGFEFVRHHHLDDRVDAWPELLRKADLFFYPSTYDGWGRVVADAMCAAVPALVFDCTAPPEIADSLILCDPKNPDDIRDKFQRLVEDWPWRESVARRQHADALRLTREHRGDIADALWMALNKDRKGLKRWESRKS
jgi:glycosyltransferase involved in cell wall biosynthesis